jgi:urease accessory protein
LVYRERFRWDGPWKGDEAAWFFAGALACASLFVGGPLPDLLPDPPTNVRRAVFPLENGESCVRWCGDPASVTVDLVTLSLQLAGFWSGGPAAPPWLVASSNLAPNHWFTGLPTREPGPGESD